MCNVAYTAVYQKCWDECQPLFAPQYQKESEIRHLEEDYFVYVQHYAGHIGESDQRGDDCRLTDRDGQILSTWRSIAFVGSFYRLITHRNGKKYLIFRQDLFGYSVLDIESKRIMQFFPEASLDDGETFIWTDVHYEPATNVLAVSGCFWCMDPGVHLFSFDDPMSDSQKCIDLVNCFPHGYGHYGDVNFAGWDNGALRVSRYVVATNADEVITIPAEEYLDWLSSRGTAPAAFE